MEEKKDMATDPTAPSSPIDEIEERVEGGGEVNENEPTLPEPTAIITSSPHYVKTENKPITISVMLNNTPQNNGTATIQLDNTTLTTTTINNGIATYTPDLTNTTTGTHTLTITINPTTTYTTKTLTQTITIYNTTSEAPENYTDNYGNDIPVTINVEEGQAQLHLTKTLAVGTYTLNGQFQGTATYQTAQDTGTITITKIPTTTTLTSDTTTITQGNSINLTATINNTNATGTITLYDNGTPVLFNQTLTNGTVTMNYTPTTIGTHDITATYSGDNTYNTSTSNTSTLTVTNPTPSLIMRIEGDTFELPANYLTTTGEVTIDYGDGTTETYTQQAINHTYNTNDTYTITIQGTITEITPNSLSTTMKTNLKHITIPDGVTSLGYMCFSNCTNLTSVDIPSSVTSLGYMCFYYCRNLTSVDISSGVTSLETGCFYNCQNLTSLTIPNSVTSLGQSCFGSCGNLTSLTIPNSVTSIGQSCFRYTMSLTSITLLWTSSDTILPYDSSWEIRPTTSIIIPQGTTTLYTDKGYPSTRLIENT